jgi:streptogramin lyase
MLSHSSFRILKAALLERREPWAIVTAILVGILALFLLAELALQLAQRNSWTTYAGLDAVSAVAVDGQGQVWAAGYRQGTPRLMLYPENGKPLEVSMPGELTRTAASALMIDHRDRLWVGTENGMVGMGDTTDEWTLYASDPDFSVWEMVMDGQGRVWARSHRGPGLIDPEAGETSFTFLNSGLTDNDAVAIATDEKGQLWVLTVKRELKVLEPDGSWRTFATVPMTVRNSIFGSLMTIDKQGQIWLATDNGVSARTRQCMGGIPAAYSGVPLSMRAILPDAHGRVWVAGTIYGLFMYDPQSGWTNYTRRNSGLSGEVSALALDEEGQLWVGSSQSGLSKFVPETALPVQSLSTVRAAAESVIPLASLIVALLSMWVIAFARPGAANRMMIVDFLIAFAGWFILNSLLWGYIRYSHEQSGGILFINPLVLLPLSVNILLLIILYRWRRWMALGACSAFIMNWIGLILIRPAADPFSSPASWGAIFMIPFFLPT